MLDRMINHNVSDIIDIRNIMTHERNTYHFKN